MAVLLFHNVPQELGVFLSPVSLLCPESSQLGVRGMVSSFPMLRVSGCYTVFCSRLG